MKNKYISLVFTLLLFTSITQSATFPIHNAFTSAHHMNDFPDKIDITPANFHVIKNALQSYNHDKILTQYYEIDTNFYNWSAEAVSQQPSPEVFRLGKPSWVIFNHQLIKARCKESYNHLCEHHYLDDRHPHWDTLLPKGYMLQNFDEIAELLEKIKRQPTLKIYVDYAIDDDRNAQWRFFSQAKLRLSE